MIKRVVYTTKSNIIILYIIPLRSFEKNKILENINTTFSFFHCVNPSEGRDTICQWFLSFQLYEVVRCVKSKALIDSTGIQVNSQMERGRIDWLDLCLFAWLTASKTSQPMDRMHMHLRSCKRVSPYMNLFG